MNKPVDRSLCLGDGQEIPKETAHAAVWGGVINTAFVSAFLQNSRFLLITTINLLHFVTSHGILLIYYVLQSDHQKEDSRYNYEEWQADHALRGCADVTVDKAWVRCRCNEDWLWEGCQRIHWATARWYNGDLRKVHSRIIGQRISKKLIHNIERAIIQATKTLAIILLEFALILRARERLCISPRNRRKGRPTLGWRVATDHHPRGWLSRRNARWTFRKKK